MFAIKYCAHRRHIVVTSRELYQGIWRILDIELVLWQHSTRWNPSNSILPWLWETPKLTGCQLFFAVFSEIRPSCPYWTFRTSKLMSNAQKTKLYSWQTVSTFDMYNIHISTRCTIFLFRLCDLTSSLRRGVWCHETFKQHVAAALVATIFLTRRQNKVFYAKTSFSLNAHQKVLTVEPYQTALWQHKTNKSKRFQHTTFRNMQCQHLLWPMGCQHSE